MPNTKTRLTDPSLTADLAALNCDVMQGGDMMTSHMDNSHMNSHMGSGGNHGNHGHRNGVAVSLGNPLQPSLNGLKSDMEMPT